MQGWTSHHMKSSAVPASPLSATSLTLHDLPRRIGDTGPAPLPTPSSTSPRPPTPSLDGSMGDGHTSSVRSPPTPAPSPGPRDGWNKGDLIGDVDALEVEAEGSVMDVDIDEEISSMHAKGKDKAKVQLEPSDIIQHFKGLSFKARYAFLSALVPELTMPEALNITRKIEPRLRRDFLRELPTELALHCLSYVSDAKTLAWASQVSRYWNGLLQDENTWKDMCDKHHFTAIPSPLTSSRRNNSQIVPPAPSRRASASNVPTGGYKNRNGRNNSITVDTPLPPIAEPKPSFRQHFKHSYQTESNWLHGGRVLAAHTSQGDAVVTSLAIDDNYLVIGMADGPIHVFDSCTGAFMKTLPGHNNGVWTLVLIAATPNQPQAPPPNQSSNQTRSSYARAAKSSRGGFAYRDNGQTRRSSFNALDAFNNAGAPTSASTSGRITRPNTAMGIEGDEGVGLGIGEGDSPVMSDVCNGVRGWGNRRPLLVSGGCDRNVKVWDIISGQCMQILRGHTSTVRCIKVLDRRPIVVSGSRDATLRVWDISKGELVRVLEGHEESVRCIEVSGNRVVSGSYDFKCRIWDVDTGRCLHVLEGHYHQIYAVAFDGNRVISGSLDSTIRVWDAKTGACTAMLQGHTSLVGQLQLSGDILVTGGSDGRVIAFNLADGTCIHRLCAHDNSVTCLQFDDRFIISGGNDGRVKLWDFRTGAFVRELSRPGEAVWRVSFRDDQCAVLLQRELKTILEVISFKPVS